MPLGTSVIAAQNNDLPNDTKTIESLNAITARSSGVPALLLVKPIDLPEPSAPPAGKSKSPHAKKTTKPAAASSSKNEQSDAVKEQGVAPSWQHEKAALLDSLAVSYTHLTLPTNREV